MAKEWDYSKASKWMAEHGGPQKALETLKDYYLEKGFKEGAASKNPIIMLAGLTGLTAGVTGKYIYDKIMEKKLLEIKSEAANQAKVKKAEDELVTAMKQNTKVEIKAVSKSDKSSAELADRNIRI